MGLNPYDFMDNDVRPPTTNRGVERTSKSALIAVVDWVSVTFKTGNNLNVETKEIMLELDRLLDYYNINFFMTNGNHGYKDSLTSKGFRIYFNGTVEQGVSFNISGQGCRILETKPGFKWSIFFKDLEKISSINVTRFDLAIDDFKGYFTIDQIIKKFEKNEYSSRFQSHRSMRSYSKGNSTGDTIYIGHPTSEIMFRFYEKNKERENEGEYYDLDQWNRYEIQSRKKRAQNIFDIIKNNGDIGQVTQGIISYYMRILTRKKDTNKRRWPTWRRWKKFIKDVEKVQIANITIESDIEVKIQWAKKQLSRTLAMIQKYDSDIFDEIITIGHNKLTREDNIQIQREKTAREIAVTRDIY